METQALNYLDYYTQMSYRDFLEFERAGGSGKYDISVSQH